MKILFFNTSSIVEGYSVLKSQTELGQEPLEFSPHSEGVRILFKQHRDSKMGDSIEISDSTLKAYLGQGLTKCSQFVVVVEEAKLLKLFLLAQRVEEVGGWVHELRSFRSNPHMNYAIFSHDSEEKILDITKEVKRVVFSADHTVLKDFLGFHS